MRAYSEILQTLYVDVLPNINILVEKSILPELPQILEDFLITNFSSIPDNINIDCKSALISLRQIYSISEDVEKNWLSGLVEIIIVKLNENSLPTRTWQEYAEYQIREAKRGGWESLKGTYDAWRHPITTIQRAASIFIHPINTARAISSSAYQHPIRFATSLAVSAMTNAAISKAINSVTGKLSKLYTYRLQNQANQAMLEPLKVEHESARALLESLKRTDKSNLSVYRLANKESRLACAEKNYTRIKAQLDKATKHADFFKKITMSMTNSYASISFFSMTTLQYTAFLNQIKSVLRNVVLEFTRLYILQHLALPAHWIRLPMVYPLKRPKNLIFEGGGAKGLVYLGALRELQRRNINLNEILRVGGASAGAITALLLSVGYTEQELSSLLLNFNLIEFLDNDLLRNVLIKQLADYSNRPSSDELAAIEIAFKRHNGLFPGETLRRWLADRIADKLSQYINMYSNREAAKLATFSDLKILQQQGCSVKTLSIVATNTSTHLPTAEIFSAETTPDVLIVDAVRMSLSIPIIFYPHYIHRRIDNQRVQCVLGHAYMDGGVFDNYPIKLFDKRCYLSLDDTISNHTNDCYNDETLGFRIEANLALYQAFLISPALPLRVRYIEDDYVISYVGRILSSLLAPIPYFHQLSGSLREIFRISHDFQLLDSVLFGAQQQYRQSSVEDWKRTVFISPGSVGTLDFNLTDEQKNEAIHSGEVGVRSFFVRAQII